MNVFSMNEVGKRISQLRKEKNMTQLELADKLGISYQAISNWERGDSMPDIAKLSDLSEIFDVTIDELLGNNKQAEAISLLAAEKKVDVSSLSEEELKDILPIIKPSEFKNSFEDFSQMPFSYIIMMAPFLDEETIDDLVENYVGGEAHEWIGLVPFMSEANINKVFTRLLNEEDLDLGWIAGFAPFVDEALLSEKSWDIYQKNGIPPVTVIAPFIDETAIDRIINDALEKENMPEVVALMPFSSGKLDAFKSMFQFKKRS